MQIVEPEEQAEELVNITANTEELDTDDITTASILLDDLTESAIADTEVHCSSCTLVYL